MIIRRNFHPFRIWPYVWRELVFVGACTAGVMGSGQIWFALPFAPLGVVGTALAFFLAFRGNTGYARWWEARSAWSSVAHQSRVLARIVISSTGTAIKAGKGGERDRVTAFRREAIHRQIAIAYLLRSHLRDDTECDDVRRLLPETDLAQLVPATNRPNLLIQIQSDRLRDGVREECLGPFDPISLEPCLSALNSLQATMERIKETPVLRQYDFFTRVFLWIFLALLPVSLASLVPSNGPQRWLVAVLAITVAFVYTIASKVGQVADEPFASGPHDIPMTWICTTIERDLREQLGEVELTPIPLPIDGYLH